MNRPVDSRPMAADPHVAVLETPPASQLSPAVDPSAGRRTFPRLASVADFREAARRRLPRAIFDFVDGAAGDEVTMCANEEAFRRYVFRPRVLTDVSHVDLSTTILGRRVAIPIVLGPSGGQRLATPLGELAAVRAAAHHQTIFALSVGASRTLEEVAEAGRGAGLWFQLYFWRDRAWSEDLVRRAQHAGYDALCVTVDAKTPTGPKYRDVRNGIARLPESLGPRTMVDGLRRPRWLAGYLRGGPIRTVHILDNGRAASMFRASQATSRGVDPSATWDELRWLRRAWPGPLVVKGVLTSEDARLAFDAGADAVVCSNHGGRILDGEPATLHVLPRIVEVAERLGKEVYLDGGIRTGGDVVKALALGARACLITRPYWWGLAIGAEAGVSAVLGLFTRELRATMAGLGRRRLDDLDSSAVEYGG